MTEQKHTPGPWVFTDTVSTLRKNLFSMHPNNGRHIGTFDAGSASKIAEMDRDLALMCAAPDLLAALKMHHEWSIENMRGYSEFGEESVAYRATKLAIEKAEGGV